MKRLVGAGWRNGIKNGSERPNLVLVFDQTWNLKKTSTKAKLQHHNESQALQKNTGSTNVI